MSTLLDLGCNVLIQGLVVTAHPANYYISVSHMLVRPALRLASMLVRFEIPPRTRHSIHKDNSRTAVSFASHFPSVSAFGLDTYSVIAMVSLSSFMSQAKSSVLECPWFFGCFSVCWLRALHKFPFPPFLLLPNECIMSKNPSYEYEWFLERSVISHSIYFV